MRRSWLPTLGYLAAYTMTALLGRLTAPEASSLALFWPAAGVAAVWMLRAGTGRRLLLDLTALGVVVLMVGWLTGLAWDAAALGALGHVLLAYLPRMHYRLRRRGQPPWSLRVSLTNAVDLIDLAGAAAVAAVLSSWLGAASVALHGGQWSWTVAVAWSVRNAVGIVVVATCLLAAEELIQRYRDERPARLGAWVKQRLTAQERAHQVPELIVLSLLLVLLGGYLFASVEPLPMGFTAIAVLAWIGFRYAPVVAALASVLTGAAAIGSALLGRGIFAAEEHLLGHVVVAQLFVGLCTFLSTLLALSVRERHELGIRHAAVERRARGQADLLRAVTWSMADCLVVVDDRRTVLHLNQAARRLFSAPVSGGAWGPSERDGFHLPDGSPIPEEEQPVLRALAGEPVTGRLLLRVDPRTEERALYEVSAARLGGFGEEARPAVALLLHEVTEEHRRLSTLRDFAGVVAHDLKNPLMGVTSWSALLREQLQPLDPNGGSPAAASLTRIERAADRMGSLIDDLLDYSQATSVDLQPQRVELSSVMDRVVADLHEGRLWAPAEVLYGGLPPVCADSTLTHQLFANLLANSVKYVPEGTTPVVRVTAERVGERVSITVSDNGIGIPEEVRDRVFDSFFRAHTDYPGTGLGLAICQRAVERHGGHISAEGNPDGPGTAIRFSLPALP